MARVEPQALANQDLVCVFIATTLSEARRVEDALTLNDVDYVVEVQPFSRTLFGTPRYGAAFYAISGQADYCRAQLRTAGLHRGVVDNPAS
jgi:hypothetical protein